MATVNGTSNQDFIHVVGDGLTPPPGYADLPAATDGADTISVLYAGSDIVHAGGGDDQIVADGSDIVDGGAGNDTVVLHFDDGSDIDSQYATLAVTNVEHLTVHGLGAVFLSEDHPLLSSGQTLQITADVHAIHSLGGLNFDGSVETVGSFIVNSTIITTDTIITGGGNDMITASVHDQIDPGGGSDTIYGGNVTFHNGTFDPTDFVGGGATVEIDGSYPSGIVLDQAQVGGATSFTFGSGSSDNGTYAVTVKADWPAPLNIFADIGSSGSFVFDGSNNSSTETIHSITGAGSIVTGSGNDTIEESASGSTSVDGGDGFDTLILDIPQGTTFLSHPWFQNVEEVRFTGGTFVASDSFVASGQSIAIAFDTTTSGTAFNFDASAETDGSYSITGTGFTNDTIATGGGNDRVVAGGGNETISTGSGNDVIDFSGSGSTYNNLDSLNAGAGDDTLILGAGNANLGFPQTLYDLSGASIEHVVLVDGDFDIYAPDDAVAAGKTLTVDASAATSLVLDTSPETDGRYVITGSGGADTVTLGIGADRLMLGTGADTVIVAPDLLGTKTIDGGPGSGVDTIQFTAAANLGTGAFAHVSHVERILLANGNNVLTLPDLVATSDVNHALSIHGNDGDDVVNVQKFAAGHDLLFFAGAGDDSVFGGLGADRFVFDPASLTGADTVNGGAGVALDVLQFTAAGTIASSALAAVSHIEKIQLGSGTNSIALTNALVGSSDAGHLLVVSGSNGNDTVDASAVTTAANRVSVLAGLGDDVLTGGGGADSFVFAPSALTSADVVNGGTGAAIDQLQFSTAGTLAAGAFAGVSHVEDIVLANGTNHLAVPDALVTSADDGHVLAIAGGSGSDSVDASAVATNSNIVKFNAGAGNDHFTGGAGADVVSFATAEFTSGDSVNGGTGTAADGISFTTNGYVTADAFAGVSHVERIFLSAGVSHNLTLSDALVASADDGHLLTIVGNSGHDTVSASAVLAGHSVRFEGMGAADRFIAGGGADTFLYFAPSDSTGDANGTLYDTVIHFNPAADRFDLPAGFSVASVTTVSSGSLSGGTGTFDSDMAATIGSHLAAHTAVDFHVTAGDLSGQEFLVVNPTASNGYVSGADYVFNVTDHYAGAFTPGDFI